MKDYLDTLLKNTSVTMHASGDCKCRCCDEYGYHSATVVHEPTGISAHASTIIKEIPLVLECPVEVALNGLKRKLRLRDEEREKFKKWIEVRVNTTDEMLGKSRKEPSKPQYKEKEPWRPHYIVKSLLIASGLYTFAPSGLDDGDLMKILNINQSAAALDISNAELKDLANGFKDIDHVSAYKLSKAIKGTDVRFWMDLQERYDEYEGRNNI
jgi:hypothetical protein